MAWVSLFVASLFEIVWAVGLKSTQGLTKFWPSVFTVAAMAVSFVLLAIAIRTIPVGTGYAIWTGIGALGTAVVGMMFFSEPVTVWRLAFLLLIAVGVIGLKFSNPQ